MGNRAHILKSTIILIVGLTLLPAIALAQPDKMTRAVEIAYDAHPQVHTLCPAGVALSVVALEVAGRAWRAQCRVEIDDELVRGYPYPRLCSVVVHEWGHLAGLSHSLTGNMRGSPDGTLDAGHHPACGPTLDALERAVQRAERRVIRVYARRVRAVRRARRGGGAHLRMRAKRARRAHTVARRELAEAEEAIYGD